MSVYGIKIGHGEHTSCLMASKTILCQAVLTAKGGLDAHFMRYVAFTFILPTSISYMVIAFGLAVYSDLSKWINVK